MSEGNKPTCTFTGRVVEIGQTQKLGKDESRPFYKRTIKVDDAEAGSKWPNPVTFELTGDKCSWLDKFSVGQYVEIDFSRVAAIGLTPRRSRCATLSACTLGTLRRPARAATPLRRPRNPPPRRRALTKLTTVMCRFDRR